MIGLKSLATMLIVILTAIAVPAQAQFDPGMDQVGQMDPTGQMGGWGQMDPYSQMGGMGGMGGMDGIGGMGGMDGMYGMGGMQPFGFPFMGTRQTEWAISMTPESLMSSYDSGRGLSTTLQSVPQLSLYSAALNASGYADMLDARGNYLIFAPLDKALQRDLNVTNARSLLDDQGLVKGLVINSISDRSASRGDKNITAISGKQIILLRTKSGYTANGADIIKVISASNGKIIVTDGAVGM